jgi:phage shock protein A
MSIFKRLFRIASAETHSALDKLEDPVKMTEQGLRELKENLNESLKGLAEVKAIAIRTRRDYEEAKSSAQDYEQKAMLLLKRAEAGTISIEEADRLATEALNRKEQALERAAVNLKALEQHEAAVAKMEQTVSQLKSQISTWENEAKTLKARATVSKATAKLNKHLANIDSSSTVSMLEKMKEKVSQQEALAESYSDMANMNRSIDDEINKALGPGSSSNKLAELKAKLSAGSDNKLLNS